MELTPLLEEEGASNVDVFIAVSPDDEPAYAWACWPKGWGVKKVVALVHEPDYGPGMTTALMLQMINIFAANG